MPPRTRPRFSSLVVLFLGRMPSVWLGGFATALAVLVLVTDFGAGVAVAGAASVAAAAIGVEFAIDRRRGVGRRLLFRGPVVSMRRMAALVLAMSVIASLATALGMQFVASMHATIAEEIRGRSAPNLKRGRY